MCICCRTFVIWMVSLAVRWQVFRWQHLVGFGVLLYGMAEYNALVPRCRRAPVASAPASASASARHADADDAADTEPKPDDDTQQLRPEV